MVTLPQSLPTLNSVLKRPADPFGTQKRRIG
jgi:hypothetical protein